MKLKTDWNSIALAAMSLPNDEAGKLLKLLCTHINGGIVENGNTAAYAMFGILRNGIDAEIQKARHISEVNAANGRKGGAPIGNTYAVKTSENKRKQAKTSDRLNEKTSEKQAKTSENKRPPEGLQSAENQIFTDEKAAAKPPQNLFSDIKDNNIDIYNNINISNSENNIGGVGEKIDFGELLKFWNAQMQGRQIPQITSISRKRQSAVTARLREHGKAAIGRAIKNAAASEFLNGSSFCNFDWVFKPNNFVKVAEGNYNRSPQPQASSGYGTTSQPRYPVSKEGITLNSLMTVLNGNSNSSNEQSDGADYVSTAYQDGIGR